jgi:hypothetical protein
MNKNSLLSAEYCTQRWWNAAFRNETLPNDEFSRLQRRAIAVAVAISLKIGRDLSNARLLEVLADTKMLKGLADSAEVECDLKQAVNDLCTLSNHYKKLVASIIPLLGHPETPEISVYLTYASREPQECDGNIKYNASEMAEDGDAISQSPAPKATGIPLCEELLTRNDVSYWLKNALRDALDRDPVDAVSDAELLAAALRQRAEAILLRFT